MFFSSPHPTGADLHLLTIVEDIALDHDPTHHVCSNHVSAIRLVCLENLQFDSISNLYVFLNRSLLSNERRGDRSVTVWMTVFFLFLF